MKEQSQYLDEYLAQFEVVAEPFVNSEAPYVQEYLNNTHNTFSNETDSDVDTSGYKENDPIKLNEWHQGLNETLDSVSETTDKTAYYLQKYFPGQTNGDTRFESANHQELLTDDLKQNNMHTQFENEIIFDQFSPGFSLDESEEYVQDLSKALRLNRQYALSLGWDQHLLQINDLLLPFSGLQNISLGEEAFAHALAGWQQQQGFSAANADGILGPTTWRTMQPFLAGTVVSTPTPPSVSVSSGSQNIQFEWNNSPNIQNRYPVLQNYETIRNKVAGWGVPDPFTYIDTALTEWNANTVAQRHFDHNFDADSRRSYLNLKRLYLLKGISNPANYFATNIVSATFFNKTTPAHVDLKRILDIAQRNLTAAGNSFTFNSAWSFVPRTFNADINKLSNHALGKALDINPDTNPHIVSKNEITVINAVCNSILPNGLLSERNPDTLRNASTHFQLTFSDAWLSNQTQVIKNAAAANRNNLNKYANKGFLTLPAALIRGLQSAGLNWGGSWRSSKDFMHFELP